MDAVEPDDGREDVIDLSEPVVEEPVGDEDMIDLLDAVEPDADQEDAIDEAAHEESGATGDRPSVSVPGPSDDQEILDLIDDIQSTLDETDSFSEETTAEEQDAVDAGLLADGPDETSDDDGELAAGDDSANVDQAKDPEIDLVDNLGIDLTSELNRDILNEEEEARPVPDQTDDIPFEGADGTLGERVAAIAERILEEKLDAMISRRIQDAVQKEFDKLRKEILD